MKKLLLLLLAVAGASTAWADDFVEMLTNGACDGTFDGWTVTNGGSGWAIETDENGNQYWVSSHGLCVLEQTILLDEADADKQKQLVHQLTDLALLSNGLLKGEALTQFIKRSVDIIK